MPRVPRAGAGLHGHRVVHGAGRLGHDQVLAAKQVASEVGLRSIWSWGWATWSVGENNPDKPAAAAADFRSAKFHGEDAVALEADIGDRDLLAGFLAAR